jgi:hypothetical protein
MTPPLKTDALPYNRCHSLAQSVDPGQRLITVPALGNITLERFAQAIAIDGLHPGPAYERIQGRKSKQSARSGRRWLARPYVRARVDELLDQKRAIAVRGMAGAVERVALTKQWVMQRLQDNVEMAMTAKPVVDREGQPTGEYRYEANAANRAVELIGKELGMFTDRVEGTLKLDQQRYAAMSEQERIESDRALLLEARQKIAEFRAAQLARPGDPDGRVIDGEAGAGGIGR